MSLMQLIRKFWSTFTKSYRYNHHISINASLTDKRALITVSMLHFGCGGLVKNES